MRLDLVRARFRRRYQRFLADVELPSGETVVAHVPNTGSMSTLQTPGADAWLRPAANPERKLRWTLVLLGLPDGHLAVVDTSLPNQVVAEGIAAGAVPELSGYRELRREVTSGSRGSRIDLLLERPTRAGLVAPCWVEVKNNTMRAHPGSPCLDPVRPRSDFPDAVTSRGRKQLAELTDLARDGQRAVQFYLVDRTDCVRAGIAETIDPDYAAALRVALAAGVEVLCYRAAISPTAITVGQRCPFDFS